MTLQETQAPDPQAEELVRALAQRSETVAFCESLTAGLAAATLATVPGASTVLRGGFVTYATDLKHRLAGVDNRVIAEKSVVSAEVAQQMAEGARDKCAATWGVSLTGVAGPDSQDGHPVGEVFIGLAGPSGTTATRASAAGTGSKFALASGEEKPVRVLSGDRAAIRGTAVTSAFGFLLDELEGDPAADAVD